MTDVKDVERALLTAGVPVVTVGDLLDDLDDPPSDTRVRQLLDALAAVEKVESKKAGARARVYWHVERVTPAQVPPEEHEDQSRFEHYERPEHAREERESDDGGESNM